MRKLYLSTEPSTFVREGFEPAPHAYAQVLDIHSWEQDGHGIAIQFPDEIAERLLEYRTRFFDKNMQSRPDIDCAHFACFMSNIVVPDWQHAMKALDLVKGEILQPDELSVGAIGIIGTTQMLPERAFHHVLHVGIGVGDGRWLNVTGLGGNLAVSDIADDLEYQRAQVRGWYGHRYKPALVQLHQGPTVYEL
jgi:hypothetical protein